MKTTFKHEIPLILIVLLPFFYLAYVWGQLPNQIPLHWNLKGEIDRYGNRTELIIIPIVLPLLMYLIFLIVPNIDPKGKIKNMGGKFQNLKYILTICMSVLAIFIIHSSKVQSLGKHNYIVLVIGALFTILGNYFKTIKPNYFIGIRTPWTLESETVWKNTHKAAGKMWFIGGAFIMILSLILNKEVTRIMLLIILGIITIIPVVYSYLEFKKSK